MQSTIGGAGFEHEVMPPGWYAANTRHQHEKSAAQILEQKGFEVLLPLYRTPRQWKDRTQIVSLPVFPCYLFVRASLESRLQALRTPGVSQFVAFAGQPARIPDQEIASLRTAVQSSAQLAPHSYINCGDRVYVKRGPLAGVEGILVRVKNQFRVVLSVELLRQSVSVEVDLAGLERLPQARVSPAFAMSPSNCTA